MNIEPVQLKEKEDELKPAYMMTEEELYPPVPPRWPPSQSPAQQPARGPTSAHSTQQQRGPTSRRPFINPTEKGDLPVRRNPSSQRKEWGIWYPPLPEFVDTDVHPSGIVPTIQNVVSTFNLGCTLNLKDIVLRARNAEYNPRRFTAVIMRIRDPMTTCLVFGSGKVVVVGAKSEDMSKLAARKHARVVQKIKSEVTFGNFQVQNIVASCDVGFPVHLEKLEFAHKLHLRVREHVYEAFESMYPILQQHRKERV